MTVYQQPGIYINNISYSWCPKDTYKENPLEVKLKKFYQSLIQRAEKIRKKDPKAMGSIEAIIDKIEEMFPELSPEVTECDGSSRNLPPSRVGIREDINENDNCDRLIDFGNLSY